MIKQKLIDFIKWLDCTSSFCDRDLSEETSYSAMCGEFEKYIRWKFAYHMYKGQFVLGKDTVSIESFDKTDMVFFDDLNSEVHFVEWKAMTLPIAGQGVKEFINNKWSSNYNQLRKCNVKFNNLQSKTPPEHNAKSARFWSLFVFVDFNEGLIGQYNPRPQDPRYFKDGLFQKKYNISCAISSSNKKSIFGNSDIVGIPLVLPKNLLFPANLNLIFCCAEIGQNALLNISAQDYWGEIKDSFIPVHTSPETSPTNNPAPR